MTNDIKTSFDVILKGNGITQDAVAKCVGGDQSKIAKLSKGNGSLRSGCEVITTVAGLAGRNQVDEDILIAELVRAVAMNRTSDEEVEYKLPPHVGALPFGPAKAKAIECIDAGKYDEALRYILRMRMIGPTAGDRGHARVLLAIRWNELGAKRRARDELDDVREMLDLPADNWVNALRLINLAEVYWGMGRMERARECADEAVEAGTAFLGSNGAADPDRAANAVHVIGYYNRLKGLMALDRLDFAESEQRFADSAALHRHDKVTVKTASGVEEYPKLAKPDLALRDEADRVLALGLAGRTDDANQLAAKIRKELSSAKEKKPAIKFYVDLHSAAAFGDAAGIARVRLFAAKQALEGLRRHADYVESLSRRAGRLVVAILVALGLQWGAPVFSGLAKSTVTVSPASFRSGEETLTARGAASVGRVAEAIRRSGDERITIEAATTRWGGIDLASQRAKAVADFLVESHGIDRARLVIRLVAVEPALSNEQPANGSVVIHSQQKAHPIMDAFVGLAHAGCSGQ